MLRAISHYSGFNGFVSLVSVWMKWFAGGDQRYGRMVGGRDNKMRVPNMFIIKCPKNVND